MGLELGMKGEGLWKGFENYGSDIDSHFVCGCLFVVAHFLLLVCCCW